MINEFKYGQTKFDHLHLVYHFTVPLNPFYGQFGHFVLKTSIKELY